MFGIGKSLKKSVCKSEKALRKAPILAVHNRNCKTRVMVDTSSFGLGAGLEQQQQKGN